ncbi:MAG TPA: glycosyltransferase [Gemmatimonadaceae bacterium]|nr:glycosyltransferase [Gemmatimonadaceae bacterium]
MTRSPVFHDPHGRRERILRTAARTGAIVSTILGVALAASLIIPPLLPRLALGSDEHPSGLTRFAGSKAARERIAARRRLFAALTHSPAPPAIRRNQLPVRASAPPKRTTPPAQRITAGFYVNWDDNSFSSLRLHAAQLDWVICEWGFLSPHGDSLRARIDKRVLFLIDSTLPRNQRPSVHLMLTNFDSARSSFDPRMLERFVTSPVHRAAVIAQLMDNVTRYGLGGVTVDLEDIPDPLQPYVLQFVRDLAAQLHAKGLVISQALPPETTPAVLRQYAAIDDRIIMMLYDEHSGRQDSGPVASQSWYDTQARHIASIIPANKLILAVGAYGYDWNDAQPNAVGEEQTFQDVMRNVHQHNATIAFDSLAMNPYVTWTDADSTDHVVWFLDGVTAYNELIVGRTIGAAGAAVWRLGSEDPSLWSVLRHGGATPVADSLDSVQPGYDVDFRGTGELLRIETFPTLGRRTLRIQQSTGLITRERIDAVPLPYTVQRSGGVAHRIALTFDDGPDSRWTPQILDTLRSRHAPATFFLIGKNIETNIALTRRIAAEGHEVGNHTFTHPNLALTSPLVTRLQLDATERIIEAVLDRRSAFFRPPYFGDAEPTTADELIPVGIATELGYVTAGLHVDSEDWTQPPAQQIIANVLDGRRAALECSDSLHQHATITLERGCSGSVILMHDGGGDRAQTVAALGSLIDSLRAEGDTLVLLSSLAGMSHEAAMPPLPKSSAAARLSELLAFGTFGVIEWILYWLFLIAVVLGTARLVIIVFLAAVQRMLSHLARDNEATYAPSVSVVVPAYNEEKVIVKTIESLLQQEYAGSLEVVVVDDGSPDSTYDQAMEAYGKEPRVTIHRKANGGKASALNYGIARAHGEIIVGLDADTVFYPNTVARLVQPLRDERVGAVAGNAKVGNRLNIVTRWQALEYVTSQNLDRRAFSLLDCITVVPGAVGAWRRELVDTLGGFSDDTLAEDQDLTLNVRRAGYSVAYADDAIALTEAPDTLRGLANQRFRWSFGTLQCMWKHRRVFMRREHGTLGWVAMPNVWLFQLFFPAVSPIADLMFVYSLFSVWLVRQQHGSTYALVNLRHVLMYYGVFLLVDWVAAVIAFWMEPDEDRKLTWLIFLQRFAYRQVMYMVVVRSFRAAIRGHVVGWGKLERKATVELTA